MLEIKEPLVSVEWLHANMESPNLILLDASIKKVTDADSSVSDLQIPYSRFFDVEHRFSDVSGQFPNTFPSKNQFTKETRNLGINNDSLIVIYDDKGIYSSPRAWWLFKVFGHKNAVILDGGLPAWKKAGFDIVARQNDLIPKGNFTANLQKQGICFFEDIVELSEKGDRLILDARSEARFKGLVAEPRKGLRSGTILNSKNLPFELLLDAGKMKSKNDLKAIFSKFGDSKNAMVFSCGSGITACILALGATLIGYEELTVYDGSWTEYGSLMKHE